MHDISSVIECGQEKPRGMRQFLEDISLRGKEIR
jgi:hypothetical protein